MDAAAVPRLQTLAQIEAACWDEIGRAVRERGHPWRVMALATVGEDGAEARCVILREADATARELVFYTDDRSPKVTQLRAQPRATLLLWSPQLGWQLRLRATLAVAADGLEVSSRWQRLRLGAAAGDYLAPSAPGTRVPAPGRERGARDYFAVVVARIEAMDWLELHPEGHRRARFAPGDPHWLQP